MPDLSRADGTYFNTATSTPGGMGSADTTESQDHGFQGFLRGMKKRFDNYVAAWSLIRHEITQDMDFWGGQQWDAEVITDRQTAGRPCMTFNRMQQFTKQVTNEQRQNRPSIQINPVDDSTYDDAEILEGMVRHIQVDSEADAAYDTANTHQTVGGLGYIRILTEYLPGSFDQTIKIRRVPDPFKSYPDPYCQELDYSDAMGWFMFEDIPVDEYRAQYPHSSAASMSSYMAEGDTQWYPNQCVRVCEYFFVEEEKYELIKWADGSIHRADQSPPMQRRDAIASRMAAKRVVYWCKINAVEALAGYEPSKAGKIDANGRMEYGRNGFKIIPGEYIPIVPVLGDEYIVKGQKQYSGMVRFSKDAQRNYNYMRSAAIEAIALAPKAPFIMAEGQDENHEMEWKQANVRNLSRLVYKPVALGNSYAPAPQRNAVEPPIQAITIAINQAEHDLMSIMGLFQPSLGALGPEQSGKAILARQSKGDTANFNYTDNFSRALRQVGRVILGWIPVYYDVARMVQIVHPDGEHNTVPANQPYMKMPDGSPRVLQQGDDVHPSRVKMHNLVNFKGTVTISTGPSYQTRRQEAVASILQLVQAFPQIMAVAGDLLVGFMDWTGSREVAKRLKAILPPAVLAQDDDPLSPEKVGQLMQQHQALTEAVQKLQHEIDIKAPELMLKKYIAEMQAEAGIREAQIKKGIVDGQRQADELESMTNMAHDAATQEAQNEHERQMQDQQQAHEQGLQAQGAEHDQTAQAQSAGLDQAAQAQQAGQQQGQQQLAQQHEQALQTQQQQHALELQQLQARHGRELQERKAFHDKALARLKPKPKPAAKKK